MAGDDDLYELAGESTWERQQRRTKPPRPVSPSGTATVAAVATKPKTKVPSARSAAKPSAPVPLDDAAVPEPSLWLDPAQPVFRDRDIDMIPLLADIERELRGLRSFYSEEAIRLRVQELNKRLSQQNPAATTPLLPLDAERIIDRWRKLRGGE